MDDNKLRFGVGVLVIATIGIGIILTFLFGAFPNVLRRQYTVNVSFPSAEGVNNDTPVRRDGVKIGRVANIELQPKGGVMLTLKLDSKYTLTHEYYPRIGTGSLISGDAVVEFVRGDRNQLVSTKLKGSPDLLDQPFTDGESIDYGERATDPMRVFVELEDDIVATLDEFRKASDAVESVSQNISQLTQEVRGIVGGGDSSFKDVSEQAVKTIAEFQGIIVDLRQTIATNRPSIDASISKVPGILDEVQATLQSTQTTLDRYSKVGVQFEELGKSAVKTASGVDETLEGVKRTVATFERTASGAERLIGGAEKTIDNVERFTRPLAENGEQLVSQVLVTLKDLDNALIQIDTFGQSLNNSDGTVRRLLEDDEIYWQIRRTIENVELATAKIRPILDDARIFSDKLARDPRELGIRGAISKRPTGTGLK